MQEIGIGLIGLGTVGTGVLKMLVEHRQKIETITDHKLIVHQIAVHDLTKSRDQNVGTIPVTNDLQAVIHDEHIQIIVETIGGIHPAKELITEALMAGKHVVTANKDLIASAGLELTKIARDYGVDLYYEASVAGGIPILRTIVNSYTADRIQKVMGIVNGTTNYILTQMNQAGRSYEEALAKAQSLGFAEADPTNDVEGIDASYKMQILAQFAFGMTVSRRQLSLEGISQLTQADVKAASDLGYTIKLLGIAEEQDEQLDVSVGPVLVANQHPLATVLNENNAIMVTSVAVGQSMFYGPGAGQLPTANSVLSDIMSITKNIAAQTSGRMFNGYSQTTKIAPADKFKAPYFMTLEMRDVPGMMFQLSRIFADQAVSISRFVQIPLDDDNARQIIITHPISKQQVSGVQSQIDSMETINFRNAYQVLEAE